MPEVEVSSETIRRIRAFKRVIDVILHEELASESDYIDLILTTGLHGMLQDTLPKEEILFKTMVEMFDKNPEFVSDFIAETLARGAFIQKEEGDEIRKKWSGYVI
jgi:hypothetical protein